MSAVADIFDRDGDGYIDYYEFVAALHPNKDAYKPLTDADKIEDEVRRGCEIKAAPPHPSTKRRYNNAWRLPAGDAPGGQMQMSQTLPSGADRSQQIPGKRDYPGKDIRNSKKSRCGSSERAVKRKV